MKKIISKVLAAFLIILPASAYEWGGLISDNFRFNTAKLDKLDDIYFKNGTGISLWGNLPLVNNSDWYISAQGSYKTNYSFRGLNKDATFSQIADLDLLKLNGNVKIKNSSISLSAGRFFVMDTTTKVFTQNCDGVSLKFTNQFANVGIYGGYTGLINGNTVVFIDKDGALENNSGDLYTSTHPYLPVLASIEFPSLFLNQTLGVQLSGFIDLGEDNYNRLYGTAYLKGPFGGPFYYSLTSCFGTEDFTTVNNLSILSLMCFVSRSTIKLNCEYASGEQFIFKPFKGFNSAIAYNANWYPEYSGLLMPGLDYIFSIKDICLETSGKFIMSLPEDEIIIQGVSADFKCLANIFSDVSYEVGFAFYYDLVNPGEIINYAINTGLSISF